MRKAKAICITDTHATPNNVKLQESIWNQLFDVAEEMGIKRVFHLGDWVTARKSQSLEVLEHLSWIKKNVIENDLSLTGISGNHDKSSQESVFAYPNILDHKSFGIVETFFQLDISEDVCVSFLPYFPETGSCKKRLMELSMMVNKKKFNILACHQGINGGLAHENATTNKELPSDSFDSFDLVLSGHYHNRNNIDSDNSDIWYIGSAFAANYGEDNEKGFTIIYDDGSIEFINSEFPKYETISVEVDKINGEWLSKTKKHIKETSNNVRLIVSGDESELKKIKKQKFSDIGIKKLNLNTDSVAIRDKNDKVVFVNLDKKTVLKEYKRFSVNQEVDPSLGLEYLNV